MIKLYDVLSLELLALVAGTFLVVWVSREGVTCKKLGKFVGYVTILASLVLMGLSVYHSTWGKKKYKMDIRPTSSMQPGTGFTPRRIKKPPPPSDQP